MLLTLLGGGEFVVGCKKDGGRRVDGSKKVRLGLNEPTNRDILTVLKSTRAFVMLMNFEVVKRTLSI